MTFVEKKKEEFISPKKTILQTTGKDQNLQDQRIKIF